MKEKKLLTKGEVAEYTGFTTQAIQNWIKKGYLVPKKIGKKEYFEKFVLDSLFTEFKEIEELRGRIEDKKKELKRVEDNLDRQIKEFHETGIYGGELDERLSISYIKSCHRANIISNLECEILKYCIEKEHRTEFVMKKFDISSKSYLNKIINNAITKINKTSLISVIKDRDNQIKELLRVPDTTLIKDLDWSVRLLHFFERAEINTLGDLRKLLEDWEVDKLSKVSWGLGKKTLAELINFCRWKRIPIRFSESYKEG